MEKLKLKHGRIVKLSSLKPAVGVLTYEGKFLGSFPSHEEAAQHQREGLGHLKRASARYDILGIDYDLLKLAC
jgi:hypothetical protein